MKILILNGNPENHYSRFDQYITEVKDKLVSNNHIVESFNLREMDIHYCTGCWTCWVKTPGQCTFHDDMNILYPKIIETDLIILASPVIMGFVSSLLKKANDRFIPLIHPYFEIVNNEIHHRARYDHYPRLGLILGKDDNGDNEDIKIITDIYNRDAINLKTEGLVFSMNNEQQADEVSDAVDNI